MDYLLLRNRYRVIRRLGAGGVGSVFEVEELRRGDQCGPHLALKALFTDDIMQESLLPSLKLEFRVLATLKHPRIARVYDFGRLPPKSGLEGSEGRAGYFFTRDLIDGHDLETYCKGRSIAEICLICQQTAEVLDALHRAGMVHGDLKPANIIVAPDGCPHLIDFGLVKIEGQNSPPSGTAAYLAPEALKGSRVDRRADLYALGICIYQLVTGQLPMPRASLSELISWHLDGEPLHLNHLPSIPNDLHEVVYRLTQRDPEQRYPAAAEVALVLAEAARAAGGDTPNKQLSRFIPPAPGKNLAAPLAALEEAIQHRIHCHKGGPILLGIEGDPGSGKTTLLQELAWRSQLAGVEVIRAEFSSGDPRAYKLWIDLLSQIAGIIHVPHPLEDALKGSRIETSSNTEQPNIDNCHPADEDKVKSEIISHRLPTNLQHAHVDDLEEPHSSIKADRYATYQTISTYLSHASSQVPLLLLLDNGEESDEESRAALRFISHTIQPTDPILIMIVYRSDETVFQSLGSPSRIFLQTLSRNEVLRLLHDASGRRDEALAEHIHQYTGGNPLFVMEVLRRLNDLGWPTNPDWSHLALPRRLEDVYLTRLQELSPLEKIVLQILAVLGRPASGRLLLEVYTHHVCPNREDHIVYVGLPLERLEHLGWLDRSLDGLYSFRQGPASRMLYTQMDPEQRRAIHMGITTVLDPKDDPVEWTRHALGAGRIDLASQYLEEAIEILKNLGAHLSAIQLYRETILLLDEHAKELPDIRLKQGHLFRTVGDYKNACQEYEKVIERSPSEVTVRARIALAQVLIAAGTIESALSAIDHVLKSKISPIQQAQALSVKAAALSALDSHEDTLAVIEQALALLTTDKSIRELPTSQAVLITELKSQKAWSLGHLQQYDRANEIFASALADAQAIVDQRLAVNLLNRWAAITFRQADFTQIRLRYEEALEGAKQLGDVERIATIRYNLSVYHLSRGDYAICFDHLNESIRLFEAMGAQQSASTARCHLAHLEIKLGLYEQAKLNLSQTLRHMQQAGCHSGEALSLLLLAQAEAHRLKLTEARENINKAYNIYKKIGQVRDLADALLDLAELEFASGSMDRASQALKQAATEGNLELTTDLHVRSLVLQARITARGADPKEKTQAAAILDQAITIAQKLNSLELSWLTHAAAMEFADAYHEVEPAYHHAQLAFNVLKQMEAGLPLDFQVAFWQDPLRRSVRERVNQPAPKIKLGKIPMSDIKYNDMKPNSWGITVANNLPESAQLVTLPPIDATLLPDKPDRIKSVIEERFYRLLEIYRQVNSELDPERLLGTVMNTAVELTGAERGFLLLGSSPSELKLEIAHNLTMAAEEESYSRSIAERTFASGQPIITVSARNDPRFKEYLSVHQLQLESVLCIPIHARGKTVGVLYMESRFQSGRFTPEDQRLLMAFGDQVAIALTNARLLADNIRKAQELERAKQEIELLADERGRLLNQRTQQLEEAQRDLAETRRRLEQQTGQFGMIGRSAPMLKLFELIERIAIVDVPVLIEGESGTGKEMVARAIHQKSQRHKNRLVSINCAAIPEGLLESELFGHVRGAFTGADRERKGLFATAHGGTLFLDEIGDMPARMQVDLLRALQEKTIRPVGGSEDIKVDVRVIAASNKPLAALVQKGSFREDLFYRLNVIALKLPPLRERAEDIPLLVDHFLSAIASQTKKKKKHLSRSALKRLMEYSWPGNIRQLEHLLLNAAILVDSDLIEDSDFTFTDLPCRNEFANRESIPDSENDHRAREKKRILETLESCNWNKSRAATLLGLPRRTFYRRLQVYDIK